MDRFNVRATYPLSIVYDNLVGMMLVCTECPRSWTILGDQPNPGDHECFMTALAHCQSDHSEGSGFEYEIFPQP